MAKPTTTADVELSVADGALDKALDHVEARIRVITQEVAKAGAIAAKSAESVSVQFNKDVKMLQGQLSQLSTLQKTIQNDLKARQAGVNNAVADQAFARRTAQATQYAKTLKNAEGLQDAFIARLNTIEKQNSAVGSRNEIMTRKQEAALARAQQNLQKLKQVDAEVARLDTRARRTSGDFSAERNAVLSARSALETAALNPRRSNFDREFLALQLAADGYHTRLTSIRTEQATALATARQLNALEITGLTTKNELEAARRVALGNLNTARANLIGADVREQQVLHDIIKTEQARLVVIRSEMQEILKRSRAEEIASKKAQQDEQQRHAMAMKHREVEVLSRVSGMSNIPQVQAARVTNASAIATARGELATNPGLERQRQLFAEIAVLRREGNALTQRENSLRAVGNTEARQTLELERAANSARIRGMLSLEQVNAAQQSNLQRIAALDQVLLNGTRTQRQEALQRLRTEQLITQELKKQERNLTPPAAPTPARIRPEAAPRERAGIFGQAGATGVLVRTAGYAAAGAAIYGVVNALQQGFTASVEFEEGLHKLGAISGSTATQTKELGDSILQVARNSRFSAQELTEASTELAQAGYSASGIQASLKSASELALATGTTMAQSVDVMTATMGAFQLREQDAGMVANGLVAALNKSRLALPQVALGIQYAGVTAQEQNISFQDLTSAMAAMAQAGVRSGSMMGTGIRQFLTDLASPTQKLSDTLRRLGLSFADVDVATLGLPQVLRNLAAAGFSASEAYGSMEKRGAAAYLAMQSQLPVFDNVKTAMSNQTAAADAAAKAGDTLAAAWQRAKNRVFANWNEGMGPFNKWLANLLNAGNQSDEMTALLERRTEALKKAGLAGSGTNLYSLNKEQKENIQQVLDEYEQAYESLSRTEQDLIEVNQRYATSIEEVNTKAAKSTDTFNTGKNTLASFEETLKSVTMRSGSLKDGSQALEAETVSLMNRYPELARNVDIASNSYMSLIEAMRAARGDMIATNSVLAGAMEQDRLGAAQEKKNKGDALLRRIKTNPEYKNLTPEDRRIIGEFQHGGANDQKKLARLSFVSRVQPGDNEGMIAFRKLIGSMQSVFSSRRDDQQEAKAARAARAELDAMGTDPLKKLALKVEALSQPGAKESDKKSVIAEAQALEKASLTRMGGLKAENQRIAAQGVADAAGTLLRQAQGTLNSTGALRDAKPEKPARGSSEATTQNPMQSMAMAKEVAKALGFQVNSTQRPTWIKDEVKGSGISSQERLYNNWLATGRPKDKPVAKPGSSKHESAQAMDIQTRPGMTEASLRRGFGDRGMTLSKVLKERNIWHVEWDNKRRSSKPGVAGADSGADARADMSNNQFALKNSTRKLDKQLKDLGETTSTKMFDTGVASAQAALETWEQNLRDLTQSEIDARGMGANESDDRIAEMEETIRQKKEEFSGKLADGIIKQLEAQLKAIDEVFERSMAPARAEVAKAEGTLAGLDRYGVSKNVPSYVRTLAENRLAAARENEIQASVPLKKQQIGEKEFELGQANDLLSLLQTGGVLSGSIFENAAAKVMTLTDEVTKLKEEYASLQAQASAQGLLTTDLSGNVVQAIQAWQSLHVNAKTYAQILGEEVSPALDMLQGEFTTFFSDVFSGTTSVIGAFGNMAKAIVRYIQQIVAKMIASKIVEWLAALAMNLFGGGLGSAGSVKSGASYKIGSFNGGPVIAGSRSNGGPIDTGYTGRDSTLYNLAKGEYVVRSAAVRSVGGAFMRDLNNHGARAFSGLGKMATVPPPANQEMSVYVVAPQEKPTLGPKDVIVTMQQELLRDGTTKKLIKHISQGG